MELDSALIGHSDSVVPLVHRAASHQLAEVHAYSGSLLYQRVVPHKLRSRQRFAIDSKGDDSIYVLADGIALVEAVFGRDRPQIPTIVYPGDTVIPNSLPPLTKISITCASKSGIVLQRGRKRSSEGSADELYTTELRFNSARAALQSSILASLTSEERVATLLTEFALRIGKPFAGGCIFDLPLTRTDVALYLGLNPDTVSRCLSALKADGLIKTYGRASISCPDLSALVSRSPVADILKQMLADRKPPLT